ncbi:hypothetical protein M422DRAFT_240939 [Sphaerobolus stellatus SS14]|nr:hypothetical protein M422DRAFT_240939 [Sphaerobolus stellatus SS14]
MTFPLLVMPPRPFFLPLPSYFGPSLPKYRPIPFFDRLSIVMASPDLGTCDNFSGWSRTLKVSSSHQIPVSTYSQAFIGIFIDLREAAERSRRGHSIENTLEISGTVGNWVVRRSSIFPATGAGETENIPVQESSSRGALRSFMAFDDFDVELPELGEDHDSDADDEIIEEDREKSPYTAVGISRV